jgi:uncharacterized RDD family membrane protein YckC
MSDYPPAGTERVDALGRPLAAWGQRVGAIVIDEIFVFVVTRCASILFGLRHRFGGALLSLVMAAAYYAVLNGSAMGQTFGKRLLNIQVRDAASGGAIGVERAALRYIVVGLYRIIPFFVAFSVFDGAWPLWDPKRQALHDKIAGTVVVRLTDA